MKQERRAEISLLFATLIWGATFSVTQSGLADASPVLFTGVRFLIATLASLPFLFRKKGGRITLVELGWGVLVGFVMLIGYLGQTVGLKYTTVARSGFLSYFFALLVPFLQFLFFRQKPGWGNFIGLLFVLWGFSFIVDPASGSLTLREISPLRVFDMAENISSGGLNKGDVYTLIGAVGYAFYIVLIDYTNRICRSEVIIFLQMAFCGAAGLLIAPFSEDVFIVPSWRLLGAFLYLSVLGSVVALGLMNLYQQFIHPLRAVLMYSMEPVFAAVFGWFLLGSGMSVREAAGAALIMGGILVSDVWGIMHNYRKKRKQRKSGGQHDSAVC